MSNQLKKVFKTQVKAYENGTEVQKEIELAIRVPNSLEKRTAQNVRAKAWREAVEAGAIMRDALGRYLREQKLWDDIREKTLNTLRKSINEAELKLRMGGNAGLTKVKARELALQILDWKNEISELMSERNRVDANTADAIADQAQFNYFVSTCTVYNDSGKPYFSEDGVNSSVDFYLEKAGEEAAQKAAGKFADLWYGLDENFEDNSVEVKFLKDYGFMDSKGRFINKDGHLIDRDGRLVNEDGRYINEDGEYVDIDGNLVDESGQPIVKFAPFLDDVPALKKEVEVNAG